MYVAKNTLSRVYFVRGRGGMSISVPQKLVPVAASQTIKKGDLLVLTGGAGVLTCQQAIAAPSASTLSSLSSGTDAVLGIAQENITTNASLVEVATGKTAINVTILDPTVEIGLRIYNATASASELADLTMGQTYKFARWTTADGDSFYVLTTTTSGEFVYVEPYPGSEASDDYGVAIVRLNLSETIQAG
jgi:hypothetical protein